MSVHFGDVLAAMDSIRGVAHVTPVSRCESIDRQARRPVWLKCEQLQRTGSFKFRGAYHALSGLTRDQARGGVVTHSSGNHAAALSLAGKMLGIRVTAVMPIDAPPLKRAAVEGYGAEVVEYDRNKAKREEISARLARERGLLLIPPYDHPSIIAGQGTLALEAIKQVRGAETMVIPCGGGGLLAGCALVSKEISPFLRVVGAEPQLADDAVRSFRTGVLCRTEHTNTVADGARTTCLGEWTFPMVLKYVDDMVPVSEEAILYATRFLWERAKLVVEPTGALGLAAVFEGLVPGDGPVVVVLSGGNASLALAG